MAFRRREKISLAPRVIRSRKEDAWDEKRSDEGMILWLEKLGVRRQTGKIFFPAKRGAEPRKSSRGAYGTPGANRNVLEVRAVQEALSIASLEEGFNPKFCGSQKKRTQAVVAPAFFYTRCGQPRPSC